MLWVRGRKRGEEEVLLLSFLLLLSLLLFAGGRGEGIRTPVMHQSWPLYIIAVVIHILDLPVLCAQEYYGGGAATQRGIFTWHLQFSWLEIPPVQRAKASKDLPDGEENVDPFASPAMAGGLFSIDRRFVLACCA